METDVLYEIVSGAIHYALSEHTSLSVVSDITDEFMSEVLPDILLDVYLNDCE